MSVKVAINGFGRIGRLAFRQMFGAEGFEVVAEMAEVAKKVVEDPDFVEKCNTLSIVARYRNVEEINEFVQSENTRFENLIKSKGFGDRYGK